MYEGAERMVLGRLKKKSSVRERANAIINFFETGYYKGVKRWRT